MEPNLDDCLAALYMARTDLARVEGEAKVLFEKLETVQRIVREKRALVARCRQEAIEQLPTAPEAKS